MPAYLALKGKTAPSVSFKMTLINIIIYEVEFDRPGEENRQDRLSTLQKTEV